MGKNKPLSKEDLIQKIEARLQEPDLPLREFTSLTKRLANLKGWVKQGEYHHAPAQQEPQEPDVLPRWWSDDWARVFISERAQSMRDDGVIVQRGSLPSCWHRWGTELNRVERSWAQEQGLTVEHLREALQRERVEVAQ